VSDSTHSVTEHLERLPGAKSMPNDTAAMIYQRYFDSLVRLARPRLSSKLQQRVGASDVAQNVLVSLEKMVRSGKFPVLSDREQFFALLARMTRNKALKLVERHTAHKRDVNREHAATDGDDGPGLLASLRDREPTAEEADAFVELCDGLAADLGERYGRIVPMLVEGHTQDEIADALGCATRTVERKVQQMREYLGRTGNVSPRPSAMPAPKTECAIDELGEG
jgi:RNA polymerase sigma factor (sigma-70 family)